MPPLVPTLEREAAAWALDRLLIGVDEVGRGPLAGPVVAAAVVFPAGSPALDGVRDSKTLPAARRAQLALAIRGAALALAIGAASVREIDRLNIRVASALAMRRALRRVLCHPSVAGRPESALDVLIDGLPLPEIGLRHEALVDGDAHCHSVAAAGIVAKEVRDALMARLARRYPGYSWDTNMGYGTAEHQAGLKSLGPTRHHRHSFGPVAQLVIL
jgi:ribonuclease HII